MDKPHASTAESRVSPIRRGGLFMSATQAVRPERTARQPHRSGAYIQVNVRATCGNQASFLVADKGGAVRHVLGS
jgi:hypothetical protein